MNKDIKKAVALRYSEGSAPVVTAKGQGEVAQQILALAKEHGIAIQKDEALTTLLSTVRLNEEIPKPLYAAVAQVFALLYQIDGQHHKEER